jgi:hypothetical protein
MSSSPEARSRYVVPRYRAPDEAIWYHVLHGNVPGYQIDFMYCPEVPHGTFTQTHFGHLARLMKYLEPRARAPYAFALGNLSRDDLHHEPGHGGLALIFGLRVEGVLDHAGRSMPPYAHGIVAIDRALDHATLRDAALVLYQRLLPEAREPEEDTSGRLYRQYARAVRHHPEMVEELLRRHIDGFAELPQPDRSRLGWSFSADESTLPRRITIVHPDDEPFATLADTTARLGAMLYRSNIKWTTISSGREFDIPGGISIRLVPAGEAPSSQAGLVVPIDEVPKDEATMAQALFGAKPRATGAVPARVGWRARYAAQKAAESAASELPAEPAPAGRQLSRTVPLGPAFFTPDELDPEDDAPEKVSRQRLWLGLGAAAVAACATAALFGARAEPEAVAPSSAASSSPSPHVPAASARPPSTAEATSPSARHDILHPSPITSSRARKQKDEATPPPSSKAALHAPLPTAKTGAIGGTPRF